MATKKRKVEFYARPKGKKRRKKVSFMARRIARNRAKRGGDKK